MAVELSIDILNYVSLNDLIESGAFEQDFKLTINFEASHDEGILQNYANVQHTNRFSLLLSDLRPLLQNRTHTGSYLRLSFADDLQNFDISIIGLIALFKHHISSLNIIIKIPSERNYQAYARFHDSLAKIRAIYEGLTKVNLFAFEKEKRISGEPINDPLLIFLITRNSFYDYFVETRSSWKLNNLFSAIRPNEVLSFALPNSLRSTRSVADKNYQAVRTFVRHFDLNLNWEHNTRSLFQEYLQMLAQFNLLQEELEEVHPQLSQIFELKNYSRRNFSDLEMSRLREEVRPIINKLLEQPSYHIYLYCFLVNRNLGNSVIKDQKDESGRVISSKVSMLVNRLQELAEFTRNLFIGIREIARNIIDHTDSKTGVLTGRVYHADILPTIKDQSFQISSGPIKTYIQKLNKNRKSYGEDDFFELNIFDEGHEGVVSKTIKNIERLASNELVETHPYQQDISRLQRGEIKLPDFFNTKEIKLYHHAMRTASHWGLIIFSNLIDRNNGFFSVSSNSYQEVGKTESCHVYLNEVSDLTILDKPGDFLATGTNYQIILPLNRDFGLYAPTKKNTKGVSFSASNYHKLLQYKFVYKLEDLKSDQPFVLYRLSIDDYIKPSEDLDYRNELNIAEHVSEGIRNIIDKQPEAIPVLDFDKCGDEFDQSRLLRFLAFLQLRHNCENLIICNIKSENILPMQSIITLGSEQFPGASFWNAKHFVLIYSYELDSVGRRNYFTDILGGSTYRDLKKLGAKLASTHQSLFGVNVEGGETFSEQTLQGIRKSPLFRDDHSGVIQQFELVLKYHGVSYFEVSLENTLNKTVNPAGDEKIGYKVSNTHFRLGSKIHITEFIYAKRLFQNSFYSDRFAFLVARYLVENKLELKGKDISVLGYGDYSQLLINRITEILRLIWPESTLNSDIVSDLDEVKLLKDTPLQNNVILVVPINTTFSTAIKIENWVRARKKNCVVLPINLILVSHNNLKDTKYTDALNQYLAGTETTAAKNRQFPYKLFNWKSIDTTNLIAEVETNEREPRRTFQKYFIPIHSNWSQPDDCIKCIPKLIEKLPETVPDYRILEEPLLETDKISVTPDLLLDLPRNYEDLSGEITAEPDVYLNEDAHRSGHIHYRSTHFLNFIDPLIFFRHYLEEIKSWALKCQSALLAADPEILHKPVLLISSSSNINAYFIEFINRHIFADAAVINHYEIGEDYVENFQKFFSNDINQSEYIFFVDDVIHSGNTFHLINDFVRYCHTNLIREGQQARKTSCSGIFTLLNKSDNYCQNDMLNLINDGGQTPPWYFSFYHWKDSHIPVEKCPICKEQKRYELLATNSMLDTVRHFFLNKVKNLGLIPNDKIVDDNHKWSKYHPLVRETGPLPWEPDSTQESKALWATYKGGYFPGKSYLKMLVQHTLNGLLSGEEDIRGQMAGQIIDLTEKDGIELNRKLLTMIVERMLEKPPYVKWIESYNAETKEIFLQIFREIVIKVFTQNPFKNIKPIRERVFSWILIELTEKLTEYRKKTRLEFRDFRYLKFLLRRATLLGSNFLMDIRTLEDLRGIFKNYREISWEDITDMRNRKLDRLNEEYEKFNKINANLQSSMKISEQRIITLEKQLSKELPLEELKNQATVIGRNSDQQELTDLKEQVRKQQEEIKELKDKLSYIIQARNNILYKDISLKEFSYFYVSLIKELTLGHESKIITLERNVDELISLIDHETERDFYYLLRLIKLENASLIRTGISLIIKEFIPRNENHWQISLSNHCYLVRDIIIDVLLKALEDYRLAGLKQFLKIENIESWKNTDECNQLVHVIYLLVSLYKDEPVKESEVSSSPKQDSIGLEEKSDSILRNIYRVACDPDFLKHDFGSSGKNPYLTEPPGHGAFLALRFRGHHKKTLLPDDLMISNVYYSGEQHPSKKTTSQAQKKKLTETQIDKDSMSFIALNGVSAIRKLDKMAGPVKEPLTFISRSYPLKPWTILEISSNDTLRAMEKWQVDRGIIYPVAINPELDIKVLSQSGDQNRTVIDYYFNENAIIQKSSNHMVFFRIADLGIIDNEVYNDGKAVIVLHTKANSIPVERLRLLLLLSQDLDKFFKKHYEQDSLIAFMEERDRVTEATRLKHGFTRFLDLFKQVALDFTGIPEDLRNATIALCHNQLSTGPLLANELVKIRDPDYKNVREALGKIFILETKTAEELQKDIASIVEAVYRNKLDDDAEPEYRAEHVELTPLDFNFNFYPNIFQLLITELVVNSKNAQQTLHLEEKKLKFSLSFDEEYLTLKIVNNYALEFSAGERHRLLKGNFRYSSRGLGLIHRICDIYGIKPIITIDEVNKIFTIVIKLKKYESTGA